MQGMLYFLNLIGGLIGAFEIQLSNWKTRVF